MRSMAEMTTVTQKAQRFSVHNPQESRRPIRPMIRRDTARKPPAARNVVRPMISHAMACSANRTARTVMRKGRLRDVPRIVLCMYAPHVEEAFAETG
jgi:hypothetical protein